jgi:hypothetical protein
MEPEQAPKRSLLSVVIQAIGSGWLLPLLAGPFVFFLFLKASAVSPNGIGGAEGDYSAAYSRWAGTLFSYTSWVWFAICSSALFFGALGSTVSFMSRADPVEISRRSIVAAQTLGAVFALILSLMFIGGLIQGSLFPAFTGSRWIELIFDVPSWAKLMVWSFIAGFSERFVPDLLTRLIQRSNEDGHEPRQEA